MADQNSKDEGPVEESIHAGCGLPVLVFLSFVALTLFQR